MILNNVIVEKVFEITGLKPSTKDDVVKYLRSFIIESGGKDFLIDEDIETLFQLSAIWSDVDIPSEVYEAIKFQDKLMLRRVGKSLMAYIDNDLKIMKSHIIDNVLIRFPYLDVDYDKGNVSFINKTNLVLQCKMIMRVESLGKEISFLVYLPRIHDMYTLKQYVDPKFLQEPFRWVFKDKQKRCEGRWITSTQLTDLLSNKEILVLENNVKFKKTSEK